MRALLKIEEQFWKGDVEFYRRNMTEDALMVFAPPVGVLERAGILETIGSGPRWSDVQFRDVRVLRLSGDGVLVIYAADAGRAGGSRYKALACSAYVRREGAWKLAFHQQTPQEPVPER